MELKRLSTSANSAARFRFNRTFMELKLLKRWAYAFGLDRFNRTFMELKLRHGHGVR